MENERRNDKFFSRKRSFTFGAYGGVDRFICETRQESIERSILDILDSPTNETKSVLTVATNQRSTDLFEIIEKLQGSRLDEQRCAFPPPLKLLKISSTLPLVLPPKSGGYWIDPPFEKFVETSPTSSIPGLEVESYDIMERDSEAKIYREWFRPNYHNSFTGVDPLLGPLVLSVCLEEEEKRLRIILRMKECTLHGIFSLSLFQHFPTAIELAKMLCDSVTLSQFEAVSYLKSLFGVVLSTGWPGLEGLQYLVCKAPELITAFDEHRVSQNFKFGVLYQKEGQLTEEDILSNNEESEEFQAFLSILGETVKLQGFTGFRGGLDVCHGQTGSDAVVTSFREREIMFHVATKLPFTEGDTQQLQRKRHIGNDIVALVYQEGPAPFICDIISSHFLHCFIVVRRMPRSRDEEAKGAKFQVSVTAREDVPPFGPPLPDPPIFTECPGFRQFLLTKLVNAEVSCYKAERFSRLELRTRSSLLEGLRSELSSQSQCMLGEPTPPALSLSDGVRGGAEGGGGFIENFKRAIRVRSHSFDTLGVPKRTGGGGLPQKPRVAQGISSGGDKEGESESNNKQLAPNLQLNGSPSSGEGKGQSSPQPQDDE